MAFNRNAGGHTFDFDTTAVRIIAACILTLTLVGVAALNGFVAFAQSPALYLQKGSCCINGICGTLEQFKRNAKIVCLQADAIENKSVAQSIDLAGQCSAAQIRAQPGLKKRDGRTPRNTSGRSMHNVSLKEMGASLPTEQNQAATGA